MRGAHRRHGGGGSLYIVLRRNRRAADNFLTSISLTRGRRRRIAAARGAPDTNDSRHGPEDQQRDPVVCRGRRLLPVLAGRAALSHRVRPEDRRRAGRRRLLPADQLRRRRSGPTAKAPARLSALSERLLAVEDGDLVSPAPAVGPAQHAQARRRGRQPVRRGPRLDRERPCARHVRSGDLASQPASFPLRSRQADQRSAGGRRCGDAVRRPRPLQDGQRQPRPCARRPAADHGRQPPARSRQCRIHRAAPNAARCSRALPATSSRSSSPRSTSVDEIERIARRIVLAISEPFELCSHSVDIGASIGIAISPDHGTSIEALMRAADIAMYRAKSSGRRPALPVRRRTRRRASAEDRNRKGADRGRPARRVRARLPAADEPGHRRGCRRRSAAALEPPARRACACPQPSSRLPSGPASSPRSANGSLPRSRRRSANWQRSGFDGRLAFNISPRQVDRPDFFVKLRQNFRRCRGAAVD